MEAGRELDALVAEKVMGRIVIPERILKTDNATNLKEIPKYSTDISAAWQVVEKMRVTHWIEIHDSPDGDWSCFWTPRGQGNKDITEAKHLFQKADTAMLAICLAALKAKGVE